MNLRVIQTERSILNHYLLASSYFLHLMATVIWIGGMMVLVLVVYPLQRRAESEQWQPLLDALAMRFRPIGNFCLLVLLMTGVVQTTEDANYGGLLNFDSAWSRAILGKHIAFLAMIGVVVFLQLGLAPMLERAQLLEKKGIANDLPQLRRREQRLTQINLFLGVLVLLFTAIATAL